MADIAFLKSHLGVHPNVPKPGITFLDFLPILRSPLAFETLITHLLHHVTSVILPRLAAENPGAAPQKIDAVVGLDARGFLIGPVLALRLGAAFVPVRKAGKLPGECAQALYEKEYGTDTFEMQLDSLKEGQNVIVVDDLIATGGSAKAAGELVSKAGAKTAGYVFVIGLPSLKGHEQLDAPCYSIIQADDEYPDQTASDSANQLKSQSK